MVVFSLPHLFGFLLAFARVGAVVALLPVPALKRAPAAVRIVLALALTLLTAPWWPSPELSLNGPYGAAGLGWRLAGWMLAEATFGVAVGLVVAILADAFSLAAQVLGLQAGYGYASTIDPNTDADSGILLILAQWSAWLLFLALGFDRVVVRALALSFSAQPAGEFAFSPASRAALLELTGTLFSTAVRLALPLVALLALVDLALAVFGKLNAQLQLLSLAFPAKMLVALGVLGLGFPVWARVFEGLARQAQATLMRVAAGV